MASIKVTYGQTSRKYTVASNTTWKEFESQLRNLFNISNEVTISVSYIDEDGDVITLSTDQELRQILSDQESFGANVKFNVYTSENPDNNNNGWILENAEEKEESVATLSDDEVISNKDEGIATHKVDESSETENIEIKQVTNEATSNKDEEIIAYKISEPSGTENTVTNETTTSNKDEEIVASNIDEPGETDEHTEIKQVVNVQTEKQQPAVETNYPHVTVTDEKDDPLFKPTVLNERQSEELSVPADSVNEEKEQTQETTTESSNNAEKSPSTSNENDEESKNDSDIIFIISSSPWIQRTYYRPRVSLFGNLLNDYSTHFSHFSRPRYSYITPSFGLRRRLYIEPRSHRFITSRHHNGFGCGLYSSIY